MYIVIFAGSVPPLSPFLKRHFSKPSVHRYDRNKRSIQEDETKLTSATAPSGHTGTFTSAEGKKNISNAGLDSTENILNEMGQGDILMTTRVKVSRDNWVDSRVAKPSA